METKLKVCLGFMVLAVWLAGLPASAEVVDKIIAVINDDIILQSEFEDFVKPIEARIKKQGLPPEQEARLIARMRSQVLDQMIDKKLAQQQIRKLNIVVDEQEVDRSIEMIKRANYYTDEELLQALEEEGVTYQQYREEVKSQIERARLVAHEVRSKIVITDAEIKRYYDRHRDIYGGKQRLHLRHILMAVPAGADKAGKDAVRKRMEEIYRRLAAGESFQDLARKYSESPVAEDGGDLGLINPDDLAFPIKQAIGKLKEGEFTPVLDTEQGYQIFLLEKKVTVGAKPLEAVRDEIRRTLYNQVVDRKYKQWLEDLKARSHIRILHRPGMQEQADKSGRG